MTTSVNAVWTDHDVIFYFIRRTDKLDKVESFYTYAYLLTFCYNSMFCQTSSCVTEMPTDACIGNLRGHQCVSADPPWAGILEFQEQLLIRIMDPGYF